MVGLGRVELPTRSLGNCCSIHLSYSPTISLYKNLCQGTGDMGTCQAFDRSKLAREERKPFSSMQNSRCNEYRGCASKGRTTT